jgi:hypothetical protein
MSSAASTTHSGAQLIGDPSPTEAPEEQTPTVTTKEASLPMATATVHPTASTSTEEELSAPKPPSSPLTTANLEQLEKEEEKALPPPNLNLTQSLHLARDTALALITAQNLRKMKRTNLTLKDFHKSFNQELDTKIQFGKAYRPQSNTKLDHPIALTREILATHDHEHSLNWCKIDHQNTTAPDGCLLSFKRLNTSSMSHLDTKGLDNYLLLFAKHSWTRLLSQKDTKKQTTQAMKQLLAERKMETSLDWMHTAPLDKLYLNDPDLLKTEQARLLLSNTGLQKTNLKFKDTEPPVPEQTQKLLKAPLVHIVHTELTNNSSTLLALPNALKDVNFITQLAASIITYNPRWNTPMFCVTTHLTIAATQRLNSQTSAFEVILLTHGLNDIIKSLRNSQT